MEVGSEDRSNSDCAFRKNENTSNLVSKVFLTGRLENPDDKGRHSASISRLHLHNFFCI